MDVSNELSDFYYLIFLILTRPVIDKENVEILIKKESFDNYRNILNTIYTPSLIIELIINYGNVNR